MVWGASPQEWAHFDALLGLTADLLPVVSNPNATVSPNSKMKGLGKTPSQYNRQRQVAGLKDWTSRIATAHDIERWRKEEDYGICIQTKTVRALDLDIPNPLQAEFVKQKVLAITGSLPTRRRHNSGKLLLCFILPGGYTKRKFTCEGGIVEFLANGQQFVACGTHPSGVRYEWEGGLPDEIPEVTPEQFETLWQALVDEFAIEPASERPTSQKQKKLTDAVLNDPRAQYLLDNAWVIRTERDGRLHIRCPFEEEHTSESAESATTYWPANTGGYAHGHYACLHAHCEHRRDSDFDEAISYTDPLLLDAFSNLDDAPALDEEKAEKPKSKFTPIAANDFAVLQATEWIIKGVLPKAEVGVMFGEPASGKSFAALDMAAAVAANTPWRGRHVHGGRVVYVAAEGASGMRKRLKAYSEYSGVDLASLPMDIIPVAPNLLDHGEALELAKVIKATGGAQLIVVDTFAQATAGGNENSGEDVGLALTHCRGLNIATGALVLLIHHSGKDTSKGARGWSGLRAAVDVEMEVLRFGHDRSLTVSKQKDGEDGAEFAFKLSVVDLGKDDDGEPITSCAVLPLDSSPKHGIKAARKLGNVEHLIMRIADQFCSLGEEGLCEADVRQACIDQMPEPAEGKRDRREYQIARALETLLLSGTLEKKNGLLVVPK